MYLIIDEFNRMFTMKNLPKEVKDAHADGNYKNNNEDNLELICPNCHSLTYNYKSANKNGRKNRKKYSTCSSVGRAVDL